MAKTPSKARRPTVLLPALLCLMSVAVRQGGAQDLAMPSTALLAASLNPPHVVRGDDGRDHVEYDLLVTNAFASPVTLAAVEITGPGGAVLGRIEGATLAAATQGVLEQAPVAVVGCDDGELGPVVGDVTLQQRQRAPADRAEADHHDRAVETGMLRPIRHDEVFRAAALGPP